MTQSFLHIIRNFNAHPDAVDYLKNKYGWQSEPTVFNGGDLAVKEVREFFSFAAKRPLDDIDMILVITSCELISAEVANTMLKILEEPPPYLCIHLVTNNESQVIPTIISRTRRIRHDLESSSSDIEWDWRSMSLLEKIKWAKELAESEDTSENIIKWLEKEKINKNWSEAREIEKLLNKITKSNSNSRLILEEFALKTVSDIKK